MAIWSHLQEMLIKKQSAEECAQYAIFNESKVGKTFKPECDYVCVCMCVCRATFLFKKKNRMRNQELVKMVTYSKKTEWKRV